MHRLLTAAFSTALIGLAALTAGAAQAAPVPPIPLQVFFKNPSYAAASLSPDGRHVAFATQTADGQGGLMVVDLLDPTHSQVLGSSTETTVLNIRWVNDKRLVYQVIRGAIGIDSYLLGDDFAANIDGSEVQHLISHNFSMLQLPGRSERLLDWHWEINRTLRDGSNDVLVEGYMYDQRGQFQEMRLGRLDTRNGLMHSLSSKAPEHAINWWADDHGRLLAVSAQQNDHYQMLLPDGEGWKAVTEGNGFTGIGINFRPLSSEAGKLWVVGPDPERHSDTRVLSQLDLEHPGTPPSVLLSLPGYDFSGDLIVDAPSHKLVGAYYENDARGTVWFDENMRALQAEIDKALPSTSNLIQCSDCLGKAPVLVRAESDRQPPVYLRYDRDTHKLSVLLRSRAWIDPRQMGRRELLRFKARDGMSIPVMITQPAGPPQAKRPAVVLVHGGPWARGTHWADWERDAEAQFLASRGYVVIEPEFRGSEGYGNRLFHAGFKQWGLAMQDDVSDAMDFAVSKGWVDPQRVCIGGASYGGYATLMGLAKEPERYRCGFEWVGVSDIQLMYDISWSDASEAWKNYGMPRMIGDPVRDAEQLKATSPVQLAARINKPLLLAYGGYDRRVPAKHGEVFRDAVKAHNDQVEWVLYPNEAHGWAALETNLDFWGRVEKLLARTIGDGANP